MRTLALALVLSVFSGCDRPQVRVMGRLAFRDPTGCASPVIYSQDVDWARCHAFKRSFDPSTGALISDNVLRGDALRPLPSRVKLELFRRGRNEREALLVSCGSGTVVTDRDGIFNTRLFVSNDEGCRPTDPLTVVGTVSLQYRMFSDGYQRSGTTRALWLEEQAAPLLEEEGVSGVSTGSFTATISGLRYAVPELAFITGELSPAASPNDVPALNVDTRVLLARPGADRYGYLRQLLVAFTNVVHLQEATRALVGNTNDFFARIFVAPPEGTDWGASYTVAFDTGWPVGGHGSLSLLRPNLEALQADADHNGSPDGSWGAAELLSSTSVISHEWGHSLQASYARFALPFDYDFANLMMRPDGSSYDWGHSGAQDAELGVVMLEGVASGWGQFLLNGCNRWLVSARPNTNSTADSHAFLSRGGIWSQRRDNDAVDGASFHHTRWNLAQRGVRDMDSAFGERSRVLGLLIDLDLANHGELVGSNNEARISEFTCDLLDVDSNVAHAADIGAGYTYLADSTYWVAQSLDARPPVPTMLSSYSGPAVAERVQLPFPRLLQAFAEFCTNCSTLPANGAWGPDYNRRRLSIQGDLAPQALGRYLVDRGWVSRAELDNLFRSNLMEELP